MAARALGDWRDRYHPVPTGESGMTLVEALAVLAIFGILIGISAVYLTPMEAPLKTGSEILETTFRQARASAIAKTSAYRVRPSSAGEVVGEYAASCGSASWIEEPKLYRDLPEEVTFPDQSWTVCFSPRGVASANVVVTLSHPELGTRQVEVMLGGVSRVLE
jgi:type IV fimbrial biogenesis protein FimT